MRRGEGKFRVLEDRFTSNKEHLRKSDRVISWEVGGAVSNERRKLEETASVGFSTGKPSLSLIQLPIVSKTRDTGLHRS